MAQDPESDLARAELTPRHDLPALQGDDPAIVALRAEIRAVARSPTMTVLVQGETGTGKELVARALHELSPRHAGEFVAVNCSAVPETMLESEFFGYEVGAFTDARKAKPGLLEVARGGTLFFDEVSELAPALQAKLLRVLDGGGLRHLGGLHEVAVDARFVAASNVDLHALARSGRFRSDLYYRLGVVTLTVPPLRDRAGDVPLLAEHFLRRFALRYHKELAAFEPEALARLRDHPWPGNVRELRNAIERVALLHDGRQVHREWLRLDGVTDESGRPSTPAVPPLRAAVQDAERGALIRAVEEAGGNLSAAARLLGITRETVRARLQRFGLHVQVRVGPER